jgi:hypothetical protein
MLAIKESPIDNGDRLKYHVNMSLEPHQDSPESDGKQLCIGCTFPNESSDHFCAKCGAPLSWYAATAPFESCFAEGHVYRQATERPRSLLVIFGVWLLFGMFAFSGIMICFIGHNVGSPLQIISGTIGLISVAVIWKTTRNYFFRRKSDENRDA